MNALTIYDRIQDPMVAVEKLGELFASSQMFGCKYPSQGSVIALHLLLTKISPLEYVSRHDLMGGNVSMKSQAMLADFRASGGSHKMVEKSPDRAAIEILDKDGNKYEFELTWEEAKKEVYPYHPRDNGKEKEILEKLKTDPSKLILKAKYATPLSRANMLWNRLISDSIRTIAPEVNCGQYTPEEISDFDPEAVAAETPALPVAEEKKVETKAVEEKPTPAKTEATGSNESKEAVEDPHKGSVDDPCSEALSDEIKAALAQAAQLYDSEIASKVIAKLKEVGLAKLTDLTEREANQLLLAISEKSVKAWLDSPVKGLTKN